MKQILDHELSTTQAALWWLGQSGYLLRTKALTIAIDPYLSDAAAEDAPELTRLYPPPVRPEDLKADIYVVTHDHLDHLDPGIISVYKHREKTWFVAPRQAAKKLAELGIPDKRIVVLHAGESRHLYSAEITGVFALATGKDVIDTTGYLIQFDNGRSFYHTSDTEYHPLVVAAAPPGPEVMMVPINGKWGNPNPEEAALFASAVQPRLVLPNHYDLMALNAENPKTFAWFCDQYGLNEQCIIPQLMEPVVIDG